VDILFLGTSSGTPTKMRNVTGLALVEETGSAWYLIDCGEGTQHRLLHTPLSLVDLQAVFITHVHGDHCYGLPGLVASAGMMARKKPLRIIAPAAIEDWIRSTQQLTQLFLPYELQFEATELQDRWNINNWLVQATLLSHRVPSFGYTFTEASVEPHLDLEKLTADGIPKGPAWSQLRKGIDVPYDGKILKSSDYIRFARAPRRVVVGGDNDRPELLTDACRQAQVLIHEATHTEEVAKKMGVGIGHSTAASVAAFAQSAGLPNLVLTHFSPRYQSGPGHSPSIDEIRTEAQRHYHGQLFLAEDFSRFRLSKSRQLSRVA
jgi:ribonuclease Z